MLGLLSFYQLPQHNALLLPAPPQCSDSRQTNRDLLPQIHGKASKDTIPTKQQRSPYIGRFDRKREIWPIQKLKGKIEEMHDLNKPSAAIATTLTLPISSSSSFFFFFSSVVLVHCSDFFSFLAEQWTLLCDISFYCLVSYLKFLKPFYTWLALEMLKTYTPSVPFFLSCLKSQIF